MRCILILAGLSLVAVSLATGQAPGQPASDVAGRSRSEREVRDLEAQFSEAVVRGDRGYYNRVLAEDFTHTSHSGLFKTRAQWLAESKSGDQPDARPGTTHYDALDLDDLAVRVYGDTAVVTGRTTPKGRNSKGQPMTGRYRFLRVWVKQQGQWRVVAFQGTRIAEP
ncbi:MAG TPA: nuclear transport factor 2 family protein [Isosphaeraceae bacterium]|nr:nuclear transport factor 2 family protein [Isosphaeraceae bacterium]